MCVDQEETFYAAGVQQPWILGDKIDPVSVMCGEEEIAFLHEDIRGATKHLRVIAIAKLGEKHADGLRALALKRAGDMAGLIAELPGGITDSLSCFFGNRPVGGVVQHERDRSRAEIKMLREHFQAYRPCGFGRGRGLLRHQVRFASLLHEIRSNAENTRACEV